MFGNQEELNKQIQNSMIINLIGANYLHETIVSLCLDVTEGEYAGRFRIVNLLNIDSLIVKNKNLKPSEKMGYGLLNLEWLKKTTTQRPATIILVYDLRNKPENISYKDYENSIFSDIQKAKKMDNYTFTNVLVFIFTNSQSFNFESLNDEKEKSYSIKKALDPKNLHYIVGSDGLKAIAKKLQKHIVKITVDYYRMIKKNLKIKRNNNNEIKEKIIKYNIKLGTISNMKNKKRNWKYFEEAYNLLSNIMVDLKNYYYSNNMKLSYFEIKAVADWLFFKIFYLKSYDLSNNMLSIISNFNFHMQSFSKIELLQRITSKNDKFFLIEYFWRLKRYEFFALFLEDNGKHTFFNQSYLNFPGYYYMLCCFNIVRLINLITELGYDNLINSSLTSIKTETVRLRENKFFGKAPKFYVQIDPLTEQSSDFEENIWIKLFIHQHNLNDNSLMVKLMENLSKAEKIYYLSYLTQGKNAESSTLAIYFSILSLCKVPNNGFTNEKLKTIYGSFLSPNINNSLSKFPKLHLKYLDDYYEILLRDGEVLDNAIPILHNLISIAEIRNLSISEQELFIKLIYTEERKIKQKFLLQKENKLLSFNYNVSNFIPRVFDIIEYNMSFSSILTDVLRLKSVSMLFSNPDRNKVRRIL
jgi:hypothetical protein